MPKIAITDRGWKNKHPGGTENDLPGRSICFSVYNWSAKEKIRARVWSQPRQGSVMDLP